MGLLDFLLGSADQEPSGVATKAPRGDSEVHEDVCPECGGAGVTPWLDDDDNEQEEPCPRCNGSGVVPL